MELHYIYVLYLKLLSVYIKRWYVIEHSQIKWESSF